MLELKNVSFQVPENESGTKEIIKEETEMEKEVHSLLHIIRDIANLAGFEITNRIHFKHKKTGKEFK